MSKNTRNRILLTAVAALLLVCVAVGGTLAWLVDQTTPVVNEFKTTGIDIDLTETKNDGDKWTMEMIPGTSESKNPTVSVEKTTTVDIILFVKFDNQAPSGLNYTSNLNTTNDWSQGTADDIGTDVWYRKVSAAEIKAGTTCDLTGCTKSGTLHWHLLADVVTPGTADANDCGSVMVANTVTKDSTTNQIAGGTMTWTAWAIQQAGFVDAAGAITDLESAYKLAQTNGSYATVSDIPTT